VSEKRAPDPTTVERSAECIATLAISREHALAEGRILAGPDDLAWALLGPLHEQGTTLAADLLRHLDCDPARLRSRLEEELREKRDSLDEAIGGAEIVARADTLAQSEQTRTSSVHLLIAMIERAESGLTDSWLGVQLARAEISSVEVTNRLREMREVISSVATKITDTLDTEIDDFFVDMVSLAREGRLDPLIGRANELDRVIRILSRRTKNNPVLLGDPGVGKTAIAEGLAHRIVAGTVPPVLAHARLLRISPSELVAGTRHRGDFEERANDLLRLVSESERPVILFIDELHAIVGAGGTSDSPTGDLATILKPALARGEVRIFGATTSAEYRSHIERDGALERRFETIEVVEPTPAETLAILQGLAPNYEAHHQVRYQPEALEAMVELAATAIPSRRFPDKAIDLLDEAGAAAAIAGIRRVRVADIRRLIVERTGVDLARERGQIAKGAAREVISQSRAVDAIGRALSLRRRTGRLEGALLSWAIVGPAGSGKTLVAKVIADAVFEGRLLEFDGSSFTEVHSISSLIGSPPGYIGHSEPARLVEPLRRSPSQLILLRHADLAAPAVLALFAEIIRTGRVTDASGRQASLASSAVLFTVSSEPSAGIGFGATPLDHHRQTIESLLGRALTEVIDGSSLLAPLDPDELARLASMVLDRLIVRLAAGRAARVDLSARQMLIGRLERGAGARAITRVAERLVEEALPSLPARGGFVLEADGETIRFRKEVLA
jgi:ATP-dependent Clp protease ATP-binding subunit ClpC